MERWKNIAIVFIFSTLTLIFLFVFLKIIPEGKSVETFGALEILVSSLLVSLIAALILAILNFIFGLTDNKGINRLLKMVTQKIEIHDFELKNEVKNHNSVLIESKKDIQNLIIADNHKVEIYNNDGTAFNVVNERLDKLSQNNKLKIKIIANSGGTIWKFCIQNFLEKNNNDIIKHGCEIELIKQTNVNLRSNSLLKDDLILKISTFYQNNPSLKDKLKIKVYVINYKLFMTGILINNQYLRYILKKPKGQNSMDNTSIMRTSAPTNIYDDLRMEWFEEVHAEIVNGFEKKRNYSNINSLIVYY